ncbi:efflux RND transporter permease subunit [Arcobacter aquimarinus]|uniref:RND family efflux system, inner membrane transporter, AcrB family n=1 Tax=Arcobacter aquimarinus TaxID=1315211 RepID=A0AAE7E0V2_9BACT|nr:efflux RND transporter permease subunit [Arcobacter aquimarinus]QKE25539.1 RND family efflux system, inner membrane transporter, AcrB family [Arcobacter aquimarinus]RXI32633.1 acriflavine resistance protein B [Arcobacter aquimarinus]
MIAWFARNSVAANLLMVTILAFGLFSLFKLIPLEIFPTIEKDEVTISMSLKGATPEDVESSLTIRIEESIADLEGIKQIKSTSSEGKSSVKVEIDKGYDAKVLLAEIKNRVDAINTFPSEADKAVIEQTIRKRDVMVVTLSSDYDEREIREYAQEIRDSIVQLDGVTQAELTGVRDFEISIEISQDTLIQYDLTIEDISNAINNSSLDLSSGNLKTTNGDVLVRIKSQAYTKDEFESIIVKRNSDGSIVLLKDIANVNDGFEETPIRSRLNGKNSVFIDIYRVGNESAIAVANAVKKYIQDKQSSLPQGYELSYWDDDSQIVKNRLSILLSSAVQGSILIIILLTLFLRPVIAFWVFIGIPISFAGAFFLMPVFDVTLNNLSLFGFILVLGIVVDDAIVTGENIYTHLKKSPSGEMAAINGTIEVARPVTFGVLTTIAAFVPLAFVEGDRSTLFTQIPYVVIPVLIFSLIESKFILPAHLKHIKLRQEKNKTSKLEEFQHKFADGFERLILKYYKPILNLAINNKFTTITIFMSMLTLIVAFSLGGWTKFIFFPRVPSESIEVNLTMPSGTPFEITNQHITHLTKTAEQLREKYRDENTNESVIKNIMTVVGGRGGVSNQGSVEFEITPPEKRELKVTSEELAKQWRQLSGDIIGAETVEYRAERGRGGYPIDIQLTSSSMQTLNIVSNEIKKYLENFDTVFDISDSLSDGKEELKIELTKEGKLLGITKQEISSQIRAAIYGIEVQSIQRGRDDVKVMIRYEKEDRKSIANLNELIITTNNKDKIPLSNIATLVPSKGPSSILRTDRFRTINVTADIDKQNTNIFALQSDLESYLDELLLKYPDVKYSFEGEQKEQAETFGSLVYSLAFAIFAIYVLLAIPFKSYVQPLIVMSVIPFGIIGAVMGHWILGMDLTVLSLMGMLALMGVLVNDSLVLVDYINKTYEEKKDIMYAILNAGVARFRPVMLTSLTTFIGLVPLLFDKSTTAQFLIPMATSLGFGILFATFTTLILVPVHYLIVHNVVKYFKG